jgi:hypothetical protein
LVKSIGSESNLHGSLDSASSSKNKDNITTHPEKTWYIDYKR